MNKLLCGCSFLFCFATFAENYPQPDQYLTSTFDYCEEAVMPECEQIGTEAEGWYLNGQLMDKLSGEPFYTTCAQAEVTCFRGENWTSIQSEITAKYPPEVEYENNFLKK